MNRIESIHVVPTTPRQSMPSRFDVALQNVADHLARTVNGGLELAAPRIPGGTFLLGAVRAATQPPGALPGVASPGTSGPWGATALGSTGANASSGAASSGAAASVAAGGGSSDGEALAAARSLQAESQAFNAQYLQLQESMQRENREFTALSNVMKVKHDTARAAIGNIQ